MEVVDFKFSKTDYFDKVSESKGKHNMQSKDAIECQLNAICPKR